MDENNSKLKGLIYESYDSIPEPHTYSQPFYDSWWVEISLSFFGSGEFTEFCIHRRHVWFYRLCLVTFPSLLKALIIEIYKIQCQVSLYDDKMPVSKNCLMQQVYRTLFSHLHTWTPRVRMSSTKLSKPPEKKRLRKGPKHAFLEPTTNEANQA